MVRLTILAVGMVALLAGCGQVIVFGHVVGERPESVAKPEATTTTATTATTSTTAPAPAKGPAASPHVVKSVNIIVTPEARSKVTGDASRFTADALLDAVTTELKSRKLLDE